MTKESLGQCYMEPENDYSIFDKKYYSFTINVSTKKYYAKQIWHSYNKMQQEEIIRDVLLNSIKAVQLPKPDYFFELTKKGMVHLHGILYTNQVGMLMLQTEIHNILGLPKIHPDIVFKFEETVMDIEYFRSYMNKTNPDYHSSRSRSPGDDVDFLD